MAEKKTISAREVVADIRVGMTDEQLMVKHMLTAKGLQSLKSKLLAAGLLTQEQLDGKACPTTVTPQVDKRALAKNIADAVKSGLPDNEITKRFRISADKLTAVYDSLIKAGYLTPDDLSKRIGTFEETVELAPETPKLPKSPVPPQKEISSIHPSPETKEVTGSSLNAAGETSAPLSDTCSPENLIHAATEGDLGCVREILSKGANVNSKDKNGNTPLILASRGGHLEVVKLLLEKGADPKAVNTFFRDALESATAGGHTEIIELLKSELNKVILESPASQQQQTETEAPPTKPALEKRQDAICLVAALVTGISLAQSATNSWLWFLVWIPLFAIAAFLGYYAFLYNYRSKTTYVIIAGIIFGLAFIGNIGKSVTSVAKQQPEAPKLTTDSAIPSYPEVKGMWGVFKNRKKEHLPHGLYRYEASECNWNLFRMTVIGTSDKLKEALLVCYPEDNMSEDQKKFFALGRLGFLAGFFPTLGDNEIAEIMKWTANPLPSQNRTIGGKTISTILTPNSLTIKISNSKEIEQSRPQTPQQAPITRSEQPGARSGKSCMEKCQEKILPSYYGVPVTPRVEKEIEKLFELCLRRCPE